ncbi:hypothetical protein AAVH_28680 [Aphelenchoides avenae]|nr:hypothetical protein AAVH_28680 [Aphelenchus avenae]
MGQSTASSAASDLIQQLMPLRSDPARLCEVLASVDMALVGDAFAQLLARAASYDENGGKSSNRPRIPNETFEDVAAYLDRDTLDSMQLSCRFVLDFIRLRETDKLALRWIAHVHIGETLTSLEGGREVNYWLPITYIERGENDRQWLDNMHIISAFLRLSYCNRVVIDPPGLQSVESHTFLQKFNRYCGMLLEHLNATDTSVGVLTVRAEGCAYTAQRECFKLGDCVGTFKSVNEVRLNVADDTFEEVRAFDEIFFADMARSGVRCLEFRTTYDAIEVDVVTALAFGFAEPAAGGDRRLAGVELSADSNILAEVREASNELVGDQKVDFTFEFCKLRPAVIIDPLGFEKYNKGKGVWLFNDLQNKVIVEIKETKKFIKIHAYLRP